jgi:hypothetical protein
MQAEYGFYFHINFTFRYKFSTYLRFNKNIHSFICNPFPPAVQNVANCCNEATSAVYVHKFPYMENVPVLSAA